MVSVQGSLAMFGICKFGSEEQKTTWLPRMATGEAIGCFGLTEADFGSNPAGMRTRAKRDGDDWVINGTKMWITNGSVADMAIVWHTDTTGSGDSSSRPMCRDSRLPRSPRSCRCELPSPPSWCSRMSGCKVIPCFRKQLACAGRFPASTRRDSASSSVSSARRGTVSRPRSTTQSHARFSTGRLASLQLTQAKLADMTLELQKGFLLALHLGRLKDDHRLEPQQVSLGKLNNVREALAIARECRTILGASGITLEYPMLRHANNLESVLTYACTPQLVIGQALTGGKRIRLSTVGSRQ